MHRRQTRRLGFLLTLSMLCAAGVVAQRGKLYPVRLGEIPNEVLPPEAIYLFPKFHEGTAWLRNGTSSVKQFNYNFLLDEMHFIGDAKDTLAIAEPTLVKYFQVDSTIFYYDKGYLREIDKEDAYRLAVKQQMVQVADKTHGGYDEPSAVSAIKTYGTINNNGQRYQLQVKKDVQFQEMVSYYITSDFNPFVRASKRNFHILFPEKEISAFIKEHKTNFNKAEDLIALLRFCSN
jgi:hypothetical protein